MTEEHSSFSSRQGGKSWGVEGGVGLNSVEQGNGKFYTFFGQNLHSAQYNFKRIILREILSLISVTSYNN